MAKNEVFRHANHLSFPVASGVKAGDLVIVGQLAGVAQIDRQADGRSTLWLDGGWDLPVADATYAEGDPIYAHAAGGAAPVSGAKAGLLDKTSTTGVLVGHAVEAKTTTGGTGVLTVRLAN